MYGLELSQQIAEGSEIEHDRVRPVVSQDTRVLGAARGISPGGKFWHSRRPQPLFSGLGFLIEGRAGAVNPRQHVSGVCVWSEPVGVAKSCNGTPNEVPRVGSREQAEATILTRKREFGSGQEAEGGLD